MKRFLFPAAGLLLAVLIGGGAARAQESDTRYVREDLDASRSSWIQAAYFVKEVGAASGALFIRMGDEETTYLDVPVAIWVEFKNAESPGACFTKNIKGRYERAKGEPLRERYASEELPPADARAQCAFNEDCEPLILRQVEAARESILVAAYAFTRSRIAAALVSARVRGVDVRVKIDAGQAEYPLAEKQIEYLLRNGIQVTRIRVRGDYAAMHNKFMVVDRRYVVTGSYNYTTTAGYANWENVLLLDAPAIASAYEKAWQAVTSE